MDASGHVIPEAVRSKALSVLRDGRLRLLGVRTAPNGSLQFVDAVVYGHRREHSVGFLRLQDNTPVWSCTCPDAAPCAHVFAAEMVCHGVMPPGRDKAPKAKPVRAKAAQ